MTKATVQLIAWTCLGDGTMTAKKTHRPLLEILTDGRQLPDGYDAWGVRSVHPDFTSSHGYRWPYPGGVAAAPGPILDHRRSCPRRAGDGICVATTAAGMASGGIPANAVLLTAHKTGDVIGDSEAGKLRLASALVVDLVWLRRLALSDADLTDANLSRANLTDANLTDANLTDAYLSDADLSDADLGGANLSRADLGGANLSRANLTDANLGGANLSRANLGGANLTGANLGGWVRGDDGTARKAGDSL